MKNPDEIKIRAAKESDIENLIEFFISAYGEQTIFQEKKFLLNYFTSPYSSIPFEHNVIGSDSNGKIVAHYGGLNFKLKIGNEIISATYGVNAFTLAEWRGKGLNSKLVKFIIDKNRVNIAMGMDENTISFYKKINYNIFIKKRFSRYVYPFKNEVYDLAHQLGQDQEKARNLISIKMPEKYIPKYNKIIELTKANFKDYEFNLDTEVYATRSRDQSFLRWHIFNNPFLNYKVWGYLKEDKVISYLVSREETLQPTKFRVNRIVDLFGKKEGVEILLKYFLNLSYCENYLYVDFSVFGKLYSKELDLLGFIKLENEDACLLPLVTSPIENRPNNEFIAIGSKNNPELIEELSEENVYFTRIDGDRDRINRLSQIT